MSTRQEIQFATVSSGDTHSGTVGLRGSRLVGLWVPVIDSCEIRLKGSFDQTSANFTRLDDTNIDPGASGYTNEFLWLVGPGSKSLILHGSYDAMPFAKVEMSASQTDNRTLALIIQFD